MAKQVNKIDVEALIEENKRLKESIKMLVDHIDETNNIIKKVLKEN